MVSGSSVWEIFLTCFSAMVTVTLICAVGVFIALYPRGDPLMPDVTLRHLSRLTTLVLIAPLTAVAMGSEITPQLLAEFGILIPFSLANTLFSLLLFQLMRPLHQTGEPLQKASMVAIMSPNVISMPLMLLKGLCESGLIRRDYEDDADRCFTQGTSMLFVYSIAFNVLFWAGLYPLLIDQAAKINGGASEVAIASAAVSSVDSIQRLLGQSRAMLGRVAVTPAMVGIYAGLFIGLVPGLQGAIFGSKLTALTPLGGALRVLAAPVVCLNTLIMAASLAKVRLPQPVIDKYFWWVIVIQSFFQHSVADTVNQPRVEGVYIRSRRLLDDMRRQPHALTLTDMDPSGGATGEHIKPECKLSCRSGTDVEATTYYEVCGEEVKNPLNGQAGGMEDQYELSTAPSTSKGEPAVSVTLSTFLLHVLARLVLPPIAAIVLLKLSLWGGLVSRDARLTQLVIVIQSANPSAQIVIVCLAQLGVPELAAQMSLLYVGQYLLCIFTLTFWASVGMSMIYES